MELKRILARDSRSANEKALQLYGPDVLIISSQKMDHQIELIVAVDVDALPKPQCRPISCI
jgi:flagellar biosynthesis GTPase FlhF